MLDFGWPELIALLTSIGFGAVSAVVPVVNAEAYVIGSQVSAVAGPVPIAVGVGIGQMFGKLRSSSAYAGARSSGSSGTGGRRRAPSRSARPAPGSGRSWPGCSN